MEPSLGVVPAGRGRILRVGLCQVKGESDNVLELRQGVGAGARRAACVLKSRPWSQSPSPTRNGRERERERERMGAGGSRERRVLSEPALGIERTPELVSRDPEVRAQPHGPTRLDPSHEAAGAKLVLG